MTPDRPINSRFDPIFVISRLASGGRVGQQRCLLAFLHFGERGDRERSNLKVTSNVGNVEGTTCLSADVKVTDGPECP